MRRMLPGLVVVCLFAGAAIHADGEDGEERVRPFGPPPEVIEAWQNGEQDSLPGPPEWVLERRGFGPPPWARQGRGGNGGAFGPPAWVVERHQRAAESGLPGPPAEVIEAWQNGEGFNLPGPPDFVLEWLGL